MNNRDILLERLRYYESVIRDKHKELRPKDLPEECGIIVREDCVIATLIPEMQRLNISWEEVYEGLQRYNCKF